MSSSIVPENDSPGVGHPSTPAPSRNGFGAAWTRRSQPEDEPQACNPFALAALVTAELVFVFATIVWAKLTTAEALQAAAYATGIGLLAFYGRAMLLTVGRRVLSNGNNSG